MTQEKLGNLVGLSRTSIVNIEKGRQHISLHQLFVFADALKVRPEALLPPSRHLNSKWEQIAEESGAAKYGSRWYGLGPFHRELKSAEKIQKKSHFLIKAGDAIYNKLFAWKGAFGVVPEELDGMFVSDKFPTYELNRNKIDPRYLAWYFRQSDVWEQALKKSTGSAAISKLTLNPPQFLELDIPLPSVDRQKRIADQLDAHDARITEAKGLRALRSCRLIRLSRAPRTHCFLDTVRIQRLVLSFFECLGTAGRQNAIISTAARRS